MAKGDQTSNVSNVNASNAQNSRVVFEDSSSPFHLQNGDHPGLVLVSHSLIGGI